MGPDIKERVRRETEYFDLKQFQRDGFEAALSYLNNGIGRQRRNEVVREAMQDAAVSQVLEIGSQSWEWCLFRYGYRPAHLTCINIAQAELEAGRAQSAKLQFPCDFCEMDAHKLDFPDASFDLVFGVAILHHLDFALAMQEIHRVLRKGGKIVFMEPLRHNPVARIVRWLTPHARTPDELPLGRSELRLIGRNFEVDHYYSELFSVIAAVVTKPVLKDPINPVTKLCNAIDDQLARILPATGVYYRSVVIRGTKRSETWRD
jgi:SAM-dependent methyltransferase